jgi:hypothetical protein
LNGLIIYYFVALFLKFSNRKMSPLASTLTPTLSQREMERWVRGFFQTRSDIMEK